MAILHLFPEEGPTLNLNFAGSRTLDPRITFTRTQTTSNGSTYMGRDGLIKYAGPDEPRFDHRYVNGEVESLGLLIEEQRSNLLTGSTDFGPLYWSKLNSVGVSTNITTSPDGTTNADKFVENTDTSHKVLARSFTLTASTTYTFSIFVKSAERSNILIHLRKSDYSTRFGGFFNLTTKTFTGETAAGGTLLSSSIVEYPNNWFRLTITGDIGTNTAAVTTLYLCDTNNNIGYTGDGTSGIFLWGAQVEQGAFPTSYIPTEGSTKTRTKDVAYIDGSNFTEWFNITEGTLFVKAESFASPPELTGVAALNVPSNFGSNRIDIRYYQNGVSYCFFNTEASLTRPSGFSLPNPRFIVGYKQNTQKFATNGSLVSASTSFTPSPNITHLQIGTFDNFSYELNGCISQLTYYPTLLTDTQLISLTR